MKNAVCQLLGSVFCHRLLKFSKDPSHEYCKMAMFVVMLLPKVGNLFNMNYEFEAEKYNLCCFLFVVNMNREQNLLFWK